MSFWAMSLLRIYGRYANSPKYILLTSNRLKVTWIAASPDSAQMINIIFGWNISLEHLIDRPV